MNANEFNVQGVKITIIKKPEFEMVGYKTPANLGDGSIGLFISRLTESGKMKKLAETLQSSQQVWVCLSDCLSCGLGCSEFQICCRVYVEKTGNHDFSNFTDDELSELRVPESEWALYEMSNKQAIETFRKFGTDELAEKIGYKWDDSIRFHFDNEHECFNNNEWISDKPYYFLYPVVVKK